MPVDYVKFLMQSGILSGGDMAEYAMKAYRWLKGGGKPAAEGPKDPNAPAATPQSVAENKRALDEALELHALLSGMRMDDKRPATQYVPKPSEFWIFPAIVERLRPGARKHALDILATKIVTVKGKRIVGYTPHKGTEDGKPRKPTPDTEEYVDEVNRHGPEIVAGLTWFAVESQKSDLIPLSEGVDRRMKGVAYVVSFLEASRLYENWEDQLADAKAAAGEGWKRFGQWIESHETTIHLWATLAIIGRKRLDELTAPGTAIRRQLDRIAIETDPAEKKRLDEGIQRALVDIGKETQETRRILDRKANRRFLRNFLIFVVAGAILTAILPKIFS